MLVGEGVLAQYKSLIRLKQAVDAAAPNTTFSLERLDQHRFVLTRTDTPESAVTPRSGFVYGKGFVATDAAKSHKGPARHLNPRTLGLFGLVAVAAIGVGLVLAPNSYVKPTGLVPINAANHGNKIDTNNKPSLAACQSPEVQANKAIAKAKMPASVVRSQTIGGFREVTLVSDCDKKQYQVIMYLSGNTWKAESATPAGSHSLSGN
ncbi:MAG: hypothetical protein RL508_591 [Actinomycetota bacterium]